MPRALVIALVLATGCPDNKPPERPIRVETKPSEKKPDKPRHASHPHSHGGHPHKRDEHHHHLHPHPHLDGDDGHHHPH